MKYWLEEEIQNLRIDRSDINEPLVNNIESRQKNNQDSVSEISKKEVQRTRAKVVEMENRQRRWNFCIIGFLEEKKIKIMDQN